MVEKTQHSSFWPSLYEPLRAVTARLAEWIAPPSEASSDEEAYHIAIELPGVAEDDIELMVQDDTLVVKGEKKVEREEKGRTWYFSERQYGAFSRSFRLPPDADGDRIEAELKDGVLHVTIPIRKDTTPEGGKRVKITKA